MRAALEPDPAIESVRLVGSRPRGDADRVREELARMEWFLLGPLVRSGVLQGQDPGKAPPQPPSGIADAVERFLAARGRTGSALEADVLSGLRHAGYGV